MQTIISLENGIYPFDQYTQPNTTVFVQQLEHFQDKETLQQKKIQALRRKKDCQSDFVIKLVQLFQQDLCLHYMYEWIPCSLRQYLLKQFDQGQNERLKAMKAKIVFNKLHKMVNDLVLELIKMRVQTQMTVTSLGIHEQKLKIFVSGGNQIGRKSEVFLKNYYKTQRAILLKNIQSQIQAASNSDSSQLGGRQNKNGIEQTISTKFNLNKSVSFMTDYLHKSVLLKESDCQSQSQSVLSSVRLDKQRHRKYSNYEENKRFNKPRKVENEGQYGRKSRLFRKHTRQDEKHFKQEQSQTKQFTRKKSIRIQLQKNDGSRKRKDSVKVRVVTCHEYQIDNFDPQELLSQFGHPKTTSKRTQSPTKNKQSSSQSSCYFESKIKTARERATEILKRYTRNKK